ncbi:Kha1 protein [Martiniozyma asiatica (nom. inval.)]|nr:Kha1 protein [Martiniozyma asiatica]
MAGATSGIIGGMNPLIYESSSPYTIWFFQAVIIITISQLLYYPLSFIKQPRVIAEVLTGIILGHTVLGRIPNFTKYVFPSESIPGLTLTANIGICLLLFMVGCEVDVPFIKMHLKTALSVGVFNMAVPFGLGCALSIGLWKEYRVGVEGLPEIEFTTFMVFIAVAMCITAFPVLVRILTELRLVRDRVGIVVLAAGITNDLLGWILLALSITLANATNSAVTGYIVLVTIVWCLFIIYPVRFVLRWYLIKVLKDLENPSGPSRVAMLVILLLMFSSAFFTDIIGVHPIFGAFIVGVIVPRENNYVINFTSRIEDIVNIVFVPIYFGIAGLNVDLGLLNKGIDWAWAFGLIGVAMVGKIFGGLVAAKFHGLYWRESLTVGILMSCKGIVEIVVLQTGLRSHIISQKTYSMFILMALITTFLTTPLTLLCYPKQYREEIQDRLKNKEENGKSKEVSMVVKYNDFNFDKLIVSVDTIETVANNLLLLDLMFEYGEFAVHAISLKTLSERTADLLHASMLHESRFELDLNTLNPILSILKMFCHFKKFTFTSEIMFVLPENKYQCLADCATVTNNSLLIETINQSEFSIDNLERIIEDLGDTNCSKMLFINNNQQGDNSLSADVSSRNTELQTFFSNETIIDPNLFEVDSITLILLNEDLSNSDLISLKLFEIFVKNSDINKGSVLISMDTSASGYQTFSEIIDSMKLKLNSKLNVVNRSELKKVSTGESSWSADLDENCNQLVILSSTEGPYIPQVEKLIEENKKLVLIF